MATFKINNGDSITFAFKLTGVEAADILNLEFAIGNNSYTLANGKLEQSENDPLLFYIYMMSKDTFCLNGNYPISVAINTAELGVLKKNLVGNLAVVKTNTKMNLPVPTQIITATYDFTVNANGIIVDEFLATIAKGEPGKSAYQVALDNGFVGTEAEWLDSLKQKNFIRRHDFVTNVSYCGYAEQGSLETASVWNITKLVIATNGSTTATHAYNVKWSEHLTVTYN